MRERERETERNREGESKRTIVREKNKNVTVSMEAIIFHINSCFNGSVLKLKKRKRDEEAKKHAKMGGVWLFTKVYMHYAFNIL